MINLNPIAEKSFLKNGAEAFLVNGKKSPKRNRKNNSRTISPANYADSVENNLINPFHFPFLKGVSETDFTAINARTVQQNHEKKEYVYLPYDEAEKVYFIIRGNIEIGYLDESGKELSIDILGAGEVFGAYMGRNFSGGFARSVNKAQLAVINKNDFEAILEDYPLFSIKILKTMNNRLQILENKLQNLVFSDVKTRICKLLYGLYQKAGDTRNGLIKIPLTHQDIANLVASSRETASLHLSELKKCGMIDYERKRIRLIEMNKFERLFSV